MTQQFGKKRIIQIIACSCFLWGGVYLSQLRFKELYFHKRATNVSKIRNVVEKEPVYMFGKENFSYLVPNTKLCLGVSGKLDYVMYIFSAPDNFKRRDFIRKTWGRTDIFKDVKSKTVFMLGKSKKNTTNSAIMKESSKYGDVVISDFMESYENVSYKGIMSLNWISTFCTNAQLIVKVDDDVFFNIFEFRNFMASKKVTMARRTLFCRVNPHSNVMRGGRWAVSRAQYPRTFYPPYCNGPSWVMTNDIAGSLYNATLFVPWMPIEDVYSSGILTEKVGHISLIFDGQFVTYGQNGEWFYKSRNPPIASVANPFPAVHTLAWNTAICKADKSKLSFTGNFTNALKQTKC